MLLRIIHDKICAYRNGAKYFDGRKSHQADVPATIEVPVR